jgi:multicomponent Na+:H+ antiporter subunit B
MKGMSLICRNIVGLIAGMVTLYGVYVVSTGHLAPGGGFAGGVILMSGVVMVVLAFGGDRARELAAEGRCHVLDGLGALAFAGIALLGFLAGGFFVNFLPKGTVHQYLSSGTILPINLAIGLKVGAGLVGIFLALILASRRARPEES